MSRAAPHEPEGGARGPAARPARPQARRAGRQPAPGPPHLVRSTSWAGVHAGEEVQVDGVRQRSASWAFVAHVRNARTGEEWVEVVGGRSGNHAVRSFRPEQIFPATPGRGRRGAKGPAGPSLADAPRLPL